MRCESQVVCNLSDSRVCTRYVKNISNVLSTRDKKPNIKVTLHVKLRCIRLFTWETKPRSKFIKNNSTNTDHKSSARSVAFPIQTMYSCSGNLARTQQTFIDEILPAHSIRVVVVQTSLSFFSIHQMVFWSYANLGLRPPIFTRHRHAK